MKVSLPKLKVERAKGGSLTASEAILLLECGRHVAANA